MAAIPQFPHCDARVLHKPGQCKVCDEFPDWQELREVWKINFTGENDPSRSKCPAETERPLETINRWHGNVPWSDDGHGWDGTGSPL